ncbi:CamS family sex pheromone protein [Virgibacillus halodenitrificans]|uniref:CamS family sex pheromone protein n=1 Tax=Virgibacillus halodenitrificans TaxID=1482 RepID=A0AAC9IZV9_VIRHA|nr:CamS family sex pheromone protein [Virgibacillus halodenitrificans]APC47180.1 hypothetical protein BME96_02840 [Virgibacillus halodenitrificans]MCG1027999.1 CamS family sex pheromone protein [Virgibacillus halodenitrificans]MCJ0931892.1 CamS family sex pheromone protein [Virgibacillus halodenitrificans]MEC2159395.1 CamS family sex pheromone protein [Virgibacillus halodenitrificans]CDQ36795.1 Protein involved in sex pheromone biosynthesis [Virgibacillus halodenitrificans]
MKKISLLLLSSLLLITSCAQNNTEEEVVQEDKQEEQTSIVPSYQLSDENYKMILPYEPSQARGVITNQVGNRLDIDEMEEGLRRHSKEVFSPKDYLFQEGQFLEKDLLYDWLSRDLTKKQFDEALEAAIDKRKKDKQPVSDQWLANTKEELRRGLNPPIKDMTDEMKTKEKKELQINSPKYVTHVLEQNFLKKKEDKSVEVAGMSIGIAMKSVYRYQTETGGAYYYRDIPKKEMLEKGNEVAQTILERIRGMEGAKNIPIMIAIYREEDQSSPVPGNFVAKTVVDAGKEKIGDWESIKEENILFPSDEGKKKYFDDHEIVTSFGNEIASYFPNYVGVIGKGFYINEELQKLTLEIPIEFYGKGEVIGFTQFAYGLVKEMFSDYYDLEVKVTSSDRMESVIYRKAGSDKPTIHFFH